MIALLVLAPASGTAAPTAAQVTHSRHVVAFFETHRWIVAPRIDRCRDVPWTRSCLIGRERVRFHTRKLKRYEASLIPVGEAQIRAHLYRTYGQSAGSCMARIIEVENVVWDPLIDFGFGRGNVHEAYGLPQANPGTKMRSAGPDWRTNPVTQLDWMHGYVNDRYDGACNALYVRLSRGSY